MDEPQEEMTIKFKVGDYVTTNANGHAFIVDILRSDTSNRLIVCAEFTYNFPNPRRFDMIVAEPGKMNGVDKWMPVEGKIFAAEIAEKATTLAVKVGLRMKDIP